MKYILTCFVMDDRIANPFWHMGALLSRTCEPSGRLQATHAWGFYPAGLSAPDSAYTYVTTMIKKSLGFHFDLQGSYGILKEEEMRFLDQGYGLRGISIEISHEQYQKFKQICRAEIEQQNLAIAEGKEKLKGAGEKVNFVNIFENEKYEAFENTRNSRLNRFDFQVSINAQDIFNAEKSWEAFLRESVSLSYTCNTFTLDLFRRINIPEKYLAEISLQGTSTVLPRFACDMEEIFLHSVGSRKKHESKRTGEVTFFRKWNADKTNELFWSLPPQYLASAVDENQSHKDKIKDHEHDYLLPPEYTSQIKKIISQLQKIEHVCVNAMLDSKYERERPLLIENICRHYKIFSMMNSQSSSENIQATINEANQYLSKIYSMIDSGGQRKGKGVEFVVGGFDDKAKEKICKILDKPREDEDLRLVCYM